MLTKSIKNPRTNKNNHGMPRNVKEKHRGDLLLGTQVSEPVPGVHALDADHDVVAERGDRFAEGLGPGGDVLVEDDGAVLVEDAEVERPGVQVDAAVESVGLIIETHHGLLGKGGA